jgi:hypothetical protein
MTQTLDVAEPLSRLEGSQAAHASRSAAATSDSKFGVFAITFGIAFSLIYTVLERLNWPLFTYLPVRNLTYFWIYRPVPGEGPPMYWYGWIVLAVICAALVSSIATLVPERQLRQATFFCCVLGALWPTALNVLRSFGADWQSLDAEFMNSVWAAAVPALIATAVISYFVPDRFVQRSWTSLLLIVPIGGLVVLGYSLQQYFVR